jgi:hypothetical protein
MIGRGKLELSLFEYVGTFLHSNDGSGHLAQAGHGGHFCLGLHSISLPA